MKVAFVGGGNMAAALIGGMLDAGFSATDIDVLDVDAQRRSWLAERYGIVAHADAGAWLSPADVIVLAVKPQQMRDATQAIAPHLERPLVLSIAAGVRGSVLARRLGTDRVVRAMPNLPALIGAGITGATALPGVGVEQRAAAERILRAVGEVVWFDDEAMLDPVTALSGSGPAYIFLFMEAMQQAGRELGLSDTDARRLVVQTFAGAARLAADAADPIGVLRERVTSKGGTTAAALAVLDAADVKQTIVRAVHAANARARALADEP